MLCARPNSLVNYVSEIDLERIDEMFMQGFAVDGFDADTGLTALQTAASQRNVEAFEKLLALGADVNACAPGKASLAALLLRYKCPLSMLKKTLAAGADLQWRSGVGLSLVHEAVVNGNAPALRLLATAGADVNGHDDEGLTPLHRAVMHNAPDEVFIELVQAGANMQAVNPQGRNAMDLALNHWKTTSDVVRVLRCLGVVNSQLASPPRHKMEMFRGSVLERAVETGNMELVRLCAERCGQKLSPPAVRQAVELAQHNEQVSIESFLRSWAARREADAALAHAQPFPQGRTRQASRKTA